MAMHAMAMPNCSGHCKAMAKGAATDALPTQNQLQLYGLGLKALAMAIDLAMALATMALAMASAVAVASAIGLAMALAMHGSAYKHPIRIGHCSAWYTSDRKGTSFCLINTLSE